MKAKLLRKTDIFIILAVAVAACVFMLLRSAGDSPLTAEISVDGQVIETIKLDEVTDRVEIIPDTRPRVVIVAENGSIKFEQAECPDKVCISAGNLYRKGDTAVCLPAKVVVSISGSTVDAITW